jgi:hypothetical protein
MMPGRFPACPREDDPAARVTRNCNEARAWAMYAGRVREQTTPRDLTYAIASAALAAGESVAGVYPLADRRPRHAEAVDWPVDAPVPPAMLGNATLRVIERRWAFPPGTLHGLQEIRCLREPAGDVRGEARVDAVTLRRGRPWVAFVASFEDADGPVAGTRATFALPERIDEPDTEAQPWRPPLPDDPWSGVNGEPIRMTQRRIDAYSEDSLNARIGRSVHCHPEVARAAGLPATLAQGLMGIDVVTALMHRERQPLWPARYRCGFTAPIYCDQSVVAHRSGDYGWAVTDAGEVCTVVAVER